MVFYSQVMTMILAFALWSSACKNSDEEPTSLSAANSSDMEVVIDHQDLRLFEADSFTARLTCPEADIAGDVLLSSNYRTMTMVFQGEGLPLVGQTCQIFVEGTPKDESLVSSITNVPNSRLLYVSKPATIQAGNNDSDGIRTAQFTTIFIKAFRSHTKPPQEQRTAVLIQRDEQEAPDLNQEPLEGL
ncbi:hypothetical protein [Pseudobacteriovorax antillogorgiicola]|uniref:Lipoprotein n=1 Tax=Pseudobacteriovorax antillogorgiicola TaxID=1513793 RepID=A0A1Y6CFS0_9BACT|nr:hypothetical protein [Pseudobacteriovorax antillogorgiicola]TCS51810.1 hypothetical protein EDD56_110195 [Pseudobacteriovorax antillogorgiicola]SMF50182.1 hypothetical protein SAMN06296036_115164 [Pseudobacteriovorax antillogorgiicola]